MRERPFPAPSSPFEAMIPVFQALAPIFLLILLGYGLRRRAFVADAFWPSAEKLTYYIFFPALLFGSLIGADLDIERILPMAVALAGGPAVIAVLLLATRRLWLVDGPAFSSIFQGAVRPNSYVGLAAAASLFGPEGVTLAAVGIAAVVPLVNVMSVVVVQRFGTGQRTGLRGAVVGIATNPLIIAVASGLLCNLIGVRLPPVVEPMVEILGAVSLPLGLLAVGAGLSFEALRARFDRVMWGSAIKLLAVPGITALICLGFGVAGPPAILAVLYNSLPASASSYVLARQMGGDAPLMAGIITATTIAAAATIPVLLMVMGG